MNFFAMSPLMLKSYAIILGIGAVSIAAIKLENKMANKGHVRFARFISKLIKVTMFAGVIVAYLIFFDYAPTIYQLK